MRYAKIEWIDGIPYSSEFGDLYYSRSGGLSETEHVFIDANQLIDRFRDRARYVIAETGFGTGLNFAVTCLHWLENTSRDAVLYYIGIEKTPVSPEDLQQVSESWPQLADIYSELMTRYPRPNEGSHLIDLFDGRVRLQLEFFDIEEALDAKRFEVDTWFLDGFNPRLNESMWSDETLKRIANNSSIDATLSTYTAAGHVRRKLESVGFRVSKVKGFAEKLEMIVARYHPDVAVTPEQTYKDEPWYVREIVDVVDKKAVIVGAGLAGLTLARALLKNDWHITIIERHEAVAQEASGNPAGVLMPRLSLGDPVEEMFYSEGFHFSMDQLMQLQANHEKTFWYQSGVLSYEKRAKADALLERYADQPEFIQPAEKECRADNACLHFPSAGWVDTHELCLSLFDSFRGQIELICDEVESIHRSSQGWTINGKTKDTIESPNVILTTGAALKSLSQTQWIPVISNRGQITIIGSNRESEKIKQALSFGRFLTPARDGVHVLGASYDQSDNPELNAESQQENLNHLESLMPDMFDRPDNLNGRVGFRAVSEDRMPVVGRLPDIEYFKSEYGDIHHGRTTQQYPLGRYMDGFYVNSGHGSRGLSSCFLAAEIIAAELDRAPSPINGALDMRLNPARFLIRQLKSRRSE